MKWKVNLAKCIKPLRGDHVKTKIRDLRKENKMSQEELVAAVGTTRQTIMSLEVGKYTVSLVLVDKIVRYFDMYPVFWTHII